MKEVLLLCSGLCILSYIKGENLFNNYEAEPTVTQNISPKFNTIERPYVFKSNKESKFPRFFEVDNPYFKPDFSELRKEIRNRRRGAIKKIKKRLKAPSPTEETKTWTKRVLLRKKVPTPVIQSSDNSSSIAVSSNSTDDTSREARFFSLFTVVRFSNEGCETSSNDQNGTCYTTSECSLRGGRVDGTCASGFGVCCFFEFECGRTTSENGTYFINPSTPERICNLMISRLNDDICQIRLELISFDITGPNTDGDCNTDFFLVTGGSQVPQICGINNGQHIIYSFTSNSGPTQLSVVLDTTSTTSSSSRTWNIRVLQYECSSRNLAPVGCLQYHEDTAGTISSFNYNSNVDGTTTNQISNMNYAICIRAANGFCGIRYTQPTTDPFSFTVSETVPTDLTFPLPQGGVKVGDSCTTDYLVIPNGSMDGSTVSARDRFCGFVLGYCKTGTDCTLEVGPLTAFSLPFVVTVVTDGDEENDESNRGFRLNYSQQPCISG